MARPDETYLVQSVEAQALFVCREDTIVERYAASTSRFGTGIRENSFKTPPGVHRVKEKIGAGAPLGRISGTARIRALTGTAHLKKRT